jgi:hypothetical protein
MVRCTLEIMPTPANMRKRMKRTHAMTTMTTNLFNRSLELAAGVPVNRAAYELAAETGMNLAKLQVLGKAYRQGWLHNVLARITPLTARETTDYTTMAAMFITTKADAETLLAKLSSDLSRFATLAGVIVEGKRIPQPLQPHYALYEAIASQMAELHGVQAPKAFASTTIDAAAQAEMAFVRKFIKERFVA